MDFSAELQKLTIDGLKGLGAWIEGAKDFALEQTPLFAQEYVKWHAIQGVKTAALSAIALITASVLFITAKKAIKKSDLYGDDKIVATLFAYAGLLIFGSISTCFLVDGATDVAKAHYSPRLVIVDGIKEVISPNKTSCGNK